MDSLAVVTLVLLAVVLLVQLISLFRRGEGRSVDEETLRRETDDIKKSVRNENEIVRKALNEGFAVNREEQSASLSATRRELNERFDEIRKNVDDKLKELQQGNQDKLEEMRKTVDEKLHQTLEARLSESFKTVSERLEQVYRGLGEMQSLAQGVGDLKKALTNVKIRGGFGEIQLGRLLQEVFAPSQYETNFSVQNGQLVEFALKLPGNGDDDKPVYLPIDSKFPVESYERLQGAYETGNPAAIQAAQKELAAVVRGSAKDIRDKYIKPPLTTDFALLFLPTEGLFAEVLRIPELVDELQSKLHIIVTGPTTLLALLNALQVGFRTLAIEKRSSEVWNILGAVKREFETFGEVLGKAQDRIRLAGDEIDKLVGTRTNKILRTLRDVESLPDVAGETAFLGVPDNDETL